MSKRFQKQRTAEASGAQSEAARGGAETAALAVEERERVYAQIRERHSKAALQMAKDLHKRCGSQESEELLADAYRARIEDLLRLRMTVEARTLVQIVRVRMPRTLPRLGAIEQEIQLLEGRFDAIVAPLGNPDLAAEQRERIEAFVRQRVENLGALAKVDSLAADHALRVAAGALAAAFEAVTRGPVDAERVALTEVSRRSPLASWKGLIRAIDSYYRGDKEACGAWLKTIAADSVPARLLPAMRALGGTGAGELTAAAQRLVELVGDQGAELRRAAEDFDRAVAARKPMPIEKAARKAIGASVHLDTEARERLRGQMAACMMHMDFSPETAERALGAIKRDAYFLRVLALRLEDADRGNAVLAWEDFREDAIRCRWFAAGGVEDGVLSLHMARLVENLNRNEIEDLTYDDGMWKPGFLQNAKNLLTSPGPLFARACQADPCAESFEAWLNWAKRKAKPKEADEVAERWRKELPADARPLLHLVDASEERKAYKKSLGYLEEAEKIDGLNPAVRRARLRLLVGAALRHLGQVKASLARREIEAILPLPEGALHECTMLASALDWFCAAIENDPSAMDAKAGALAQLAGGAGRHLLLAAISRAIRIAPKVGFPEFDAHSLPAAELLTQAARICQVGELAGLPTPMQSGWNDDLLKALRQSAPGLDTAELLAVGEAALKDNARELAYAVSAAGLAGGSATERFLYLRARSLLFWACEQRLGCMAAALALARKERDTVLAEQILDEIHNPAWRTMWRTPFVRNDWVARPFTDDLLNEIVAEERERSVLPDEREYKRPRYMQKLNAHETGSTSGFDDDEDDWDEDENEDDWDEEENDSGERDTTGTFEATRNKLDEIFSRFPPGTRERVLDAFAAGAGHLDQIGRNAKQIPEKPVCARRGPVPEQESLFGEES